MKPSDTPADVQAPVRPVSTWAMVDQLCQQAQSAPTEAALYFTLANDTFRLAPYRSALVLTVGTTGTLHFAYASGLTTVESKSPYGSWIEKVVQHLLPALQTQQHFTVQDVPEELSQAWREYWPTGVSLHGVSGHDAQLLAVVVYLLDVPWPPVADTMLKVLHRFHGVCLERLRQRRSFLGKLRRNAQGRLPKTTQLMMVASLLVVLSMCLPVRQFIISPAEIISLDSVAVTASVEGIVSELVAKPNQAVHRGDVLVRLDDTAVRNRLAAAAQALEVARADYLAGAHRAFINNDRAAEVGVLKGRISERVAEVGFLQDQLALLEIRAARDGVAVYGQENDLVGKPVSAGQKLMELANPKRMGVNVWVPVADAINMEVGATFSLLLYADPVRPKTATIEQASYQAVKSPDGLAAYRVRATLASEDTSRLGLRGNAKIDGERVPLAYFLFRRPMLVARQWLGV
jgi:hypothetical protein